ncbi:MULTISPECIES: DUF998 domain-containing protein [unclassified Rhodococcus (in: high G+C Gram-positive bacteria)]|uniref:DUF998 domain-containing protein n=1 Tax=unclassified Rhodococcus (in: high G+C Gram-positive bacteria) TaxID=192944 RepID=UPI00163A4A97|nr:MULTISPECIES: DUF998 domain-containing protein [unclassified Rhodococcus (in: high G+C Gram-positive bacteria)]MBC2639059.1 DUF998 domain-containing protein [Rhodococcus sp. 3A]MBC2896199.1 DUF998 domain-containing protein [Rhodococcus sp. 4CII]
MRTSSPAQRLSTVRVGAAAWVLIPLYFVAEAVTANAWPRPYVVRTNSVSNLGVTGCDGSAAQAAAVRLCSPLHAVINSAFVLTGVLILVGAVCLREFLPPGRLRRTALALFGVAAVSAALTGFIPINVDAHLHQIVATPTFVARNAAMIVVAIALYPRWRAFAVWTGLCGLLGVLGMAAILLPGTPFGITERLALYPFTVWVATAGVAALRTRAPFRLP